jgi:hypothetical protein
MVKSYETLVDSDTRVDVNTGIGWTVTGHGFQQWAVRIT